VTGVRIVKAACQISIGGKQVWPARYVLGICQHTLGSLLGCPEAAINVRVDVLICNVFLSFDNIYSVHFDRIKLFFHDTKKCTSDIHKYVYTVLYCYCMFQHR